MEYLPVPKTGVEKSKPSTPHSAPDIFCVPPANWTTIQKHCLCVGVVQILFQTILARTYEQGFPSWEVLKQICLYQKLVLTNQNHPPPILPLIVFVFWPANWTTIQKHCLCVGVVQLLFQTILARTCEQGFPSWEVLKQIPQTKLYGWNSLALG